MALLIMMKIQLFLRNNIPNSRLDFKNTYPILNQNGKNRYPISDQKGEKKPHPLGYPYSPYKEVPPETYGSKGPRFKTFKRLIKVESAFCYWKLKQCNQYYRFSKSARTFIHKNLSVALILAQLLFMFGVNKTSNKVCSVISTTIYN